ncbi:hypothetical protein CAPTEDRAFT_221354 [Capitella teleta]|uniref:Uncharacterized protein n=1 Tax=Capitella teleta TaxID=283909 RepID=R7UNU4_CAPTE|nr:hypothetical protein CAPTEDRAFT_221354 [Capitella teleta]|eukprot:ELU07783.1 hypothetical protein CAPTEDRAFT_221354 [Capitella teleta]
MTLQKHRSTLIPDVEYSRDGSIFVTDNQGTFPLRHGKDSKQDVQDLSFTPEIRSYRSYDPKSEPSDRSTKYKQRNSRSNMQEVYSMSAGGTLSTQSSNSLARKLRRSRIAGGHGPSYLSHSAANSKASSVSSSSGSFFGRQTPQMTPEYAETLRRKKAESEARKQNLDFSRASPYGSTKSLNKSKKYLSDGSLNRRMSIEPDYNRDPLFKNRDISEERLPFVLFSVEGLMLILAGVARLVCVYWHEYFASVWAGFILLVLGVIGSRHKGDYLSASKNISYIFLSFLSAICSMVACGFVLRVLFPTVYLLSIDVSPENVAGQIEFTNWGGKNLFSIDIDIKMVTWASVAIDLSSLVFLVMGFRSLTTAMIALDNYWEASLDATDECDHRGNPRFFNPIEQMILGQAATFIGLLVVIIIDYLNSEQPYNHYYSPIWGSALVILAGFAATCSGKRTDRKCWSAMAVIIQVLAVIGVSTAAVLLTLSLASNVRDLVNDDTTDIATDARHGMIVIAVAQGCYVTVVVFCLVFACGVIFRLLQDGCCRAYTTKHKAKTYEHKNPLRPQQTAGPSPTKSS